MYDYEEGKTYNQVSSRINDDIIESIMVHNQIDPERHEYCIYEMYEATSNSRYYPNAMAWNYNRDNNENIEGMEDLSKEQVKEILDALEAESLLIG